VFEHPRNFWQKFDAQKCRLKHTPKLHLVSQVNAKLTTMSIVHPGYSTSHTIGATQLSLHVKFT